jgi:hypothetical protein
LGDDCDHHNDQGLLTALVKQPRTITTIPKLTDLDLVTERSWVSRWLPDETKAVMLDNPANLQRIANGVFTLFDDKPESFYGLALPWMTLVVRALELENEIENLMNDS